MLSPAWTSLRFSVDSRALKNMPRDQDSIGPSRTRDYIRCLNPGPFRPASATSNLYRGCEIAKVYEHPEACIGGRFAELLVSFRNKGWMTTRRENPELGCSRLRDGSGALDGGDHQGYRESGSRRLVDPEVGW